ncbi:DUF1365 domain-containing protein [Massilia sp. TS11]|uniref:DUF1365 domain-containing protein n=1 Tax=Massilia sp. TS11 TaxID=2908003 RepID=UPI001EDB2CD7|nr:DUF1365 domain-containing protein [Massilia sp. TS11]MCG2585338.1 DUF1365 domain-containing protein [Massilia sp. TS11]
MRPPEAQLLVGQVRHTRLRPARHSFHYPALYLRLPLRSLDGQALRVPGFARNGFHLLSFHDRDHGGQDGALLPWIEQLLRSEGVHDADGEIWLHCMPRVLGYAFNPVSFYFCERADGSLRAIVCDVHNTFGERHCYLLETGAPIENGQQLFARKVFHVSPFNEVSGFYRFRFVRTERGGHPVHLACIDYEDAAGAILHTSLTGCALPLRGRHVLAAFLRFPLQSMSVLARIHWQALRLWMRRVPWFHKPAPPIEKVSR